MLGTIYNMLPGIDDDYAAKLVYTLENKKSLPRLQQDIADIAAVKFRFTNDGYDNCQNFVG